jgi:hypothetical protein
MAEVFQSRSTPAKAPRGLASKEEGHGGGYARSPSKKGEALSVGSRAAARMGIGRRKVGGGAWGFPASGTGGVAADFSGARGHGTLHAPFAYLFLENANVLHKMRCQPPRR